MLEMRTPLSNPTFPIQLRPKVLRALPASCPLWPKISAIWGYPRIPLTPFRWGYPALATPRHRSGWMPLMRAAMYGHTDAVALLLQLGAAVNAQDSHG